MAFDARHPAATDLLPTEQGALSAYELEVLHGRLLEIRQELVQRLQRFLDELAHSQDASDPNDRATLEEQRRMDASLRAVDRRRFAEVDAALHRMARGEYGWCERTGEPIPYARLLTQPTARTIVRLAD